MIIPDQPYQKFWSFDIPIFENVANFSTIQQSNSFYVEDGSYFRLKNLQVGYTLPDAISERANIQSVRIYIQGSNLLTITNYSGYDPEVISYDNLSLGVDRQIYPLSKGITFGTNIRF